MAYKEQKCIAHSLDGEVQGQGSRMVGGGPSSDSDTSYCILTWWKGQWISLEPLLLGVNPFHEASILMT